MRKIEIKTKMVAFNHTMSLALLRLNVLIKTQAVSGYIFYQNSPKYLEISSQHNCTRKEKEETKRRGGTM